MTPSDTAACAPSLTACAREAAPVDILLLSVLGKSVPCTFCAAPLSGAAEEAVAAGGAVPPVSPDSEVLECSLHMDILPWTALLHSWLAVLT